MAPDTSLAQAVQLIRGKSVRRLPAAQPGRAVGIVSLGDLAIEQDPIARWPTSRPPKGDT